MSELRAPKADDAVDRAVGRIRSRATDVSQREADRAITRLRARRSLDSDEVAAIRVLAYRIAERLIDAPTSALQECDPDRAAVAVDLFGSED